MTGITLGVTQKQTPSTSWQPDHVAMTSQRSSTSGARWGVTVVLGFLLVVLTVTTASLSVTVMRLSKELSTSDEVRASQGPAAAPAAVQPVMPAAVQPVMPAAVQPVMSAAVQPVMSAAGGGKTPFTFDDIFSGEFDVIVTPQFVGHGHSLMYYNKKKDLVIKDAGSDVEHTLLTSQAMSEAGIINATMSADSSFLLAHYKNGDKQGYKLVDVSEGSNRYITELTISHNLTCKRLQYMGFIGNNNAMSAVCDDDLFYRKDCESEWLRLTDNGDERRQRNGLSFWNYNGVMEECVEHWLSPDEKYLIYGAFDSTEIEVSAHTIYGPSSVIYPEIKAQIYLKAGDPSHFSKARFHLVDVGQHTPDILLTLLPPEEFEDVDHYALSVEWQDATHVIIAWCNRQQTKSIIEICSVPDGECQRNREASIKDGWIKGSSNAFVGFIDGESYIAIISTPSEGQGRFAQVAVVTAPLHTEGEVTFLTHEAKEVIQVIGYDRKKHLIYYLATDGVQLSSHVYRVGTLDSEADLRDPVCLTCSGGDLIPDTCQYNYGQLSGDLQYLILECLGPEVPSYYLVQLPDNTVKLLQDNAELRAKLDGKLMPGKEYLKLPIGGGHEGWAEINYPPYMVKDGSLKYPVIFFPYGGPHGHVQASYAYKNVAWGYDGGWETYLASTEGVITVRLNGRGTGMRGDDFLFELYRQLGTKEIEDQIEGARSLISRFPFVDVDKIAIWGWSYGGFVTSHVIGHPSDVIKCGLAGAPVTNFRYYYAGYTERYMGLDTKDDNEAGYNATDTTRLAANFHGKKFFIVHGLHDDNVHPQHTLQLSRALAESQFLHTQQIYPDEHHGIVAEGLYRHLFLTMSDFLLRQCFQRRQ